MDCSVSFTIVIRAIIFCFGECRVVLDRPQTLHPRLIFDGIEDFVDGESQRSEMLSHLEVLWWIRQKQGESAFLNLGGLIEVEGT